MHTKKNHSAKFEKQEFTSTLKFQVNKRAIIILNNIKQSS